MHFGKHWTQARKTSVLLLLSYTVNRWVKTVPVCPNHPWVLICESDPTKRVPLPCGTYKCDTCRPALIRRRCSVMAWGATQADRVRLVTLTLLPSDWQRARGQVRDLVRRIRKKWSLEWAWAIEPNPAGTGHHAHAIQWGDYLPQDALQDMWGGRIVHITAVRKSANGYIRKCAQVAGYVSKDVGNHLEANGGRPVHMTRGYLHGKTSRQVSQLLSDGEIWFPAMADERDGWTVGGQGDTVSVDA